MRRKTMICILAAAACLLLGCVYALFFGKSGILNSVRRMASGKQTADKALEESAEAGIEEDTRESDNVSVEEPAAESKISPQKEKQTVTENTGSSLVFSFGSDADARRLVPEEVLDAVGKINAGELLADVVGMKELEGYYALTTTHMIIAKDRETGEEATGSGRLTLYVPNLLEGLKDVSALIYDCTEEEWRLVPADVVDAKGKRISVMMNGPGVVTTVHRVE